MRAVSKGLASCHLCHKLVPANEHTCPRCGSPIHVRKKNSMNRTLALLCTAYICYIPANVFPIMFTDQFGNTIESTIIGGVLLLIQMHSYPIAAIIFIASVMVPLGKIFMMFYLCWVAHRGCDASARQLTRAYGITELIGKWSMIDVFVVFILVALVNLGQILAIRPGIASLAFAGLVVVTMIAAESFDPRIFWDQQEESNDCEQTHS
ncbi:MAG: paraquat-inducible protein A [Coraliomargarita sp.]|nr:paraquat-inducible protein A [Coraliomargarita sp.]